MKLMEKYLSESNIKTLISLKEALEEDNVTVACMGLYNHGKSTLLNALIGDLECNTFKVADVRETSKNKKIPHNNIYYVDTPGLNANDEDDKQVMEAIKKADIIIFTHNINTGGLVEAEKIFLEKINKYWEDPKTFLERSIFVLSRIDSIGNDNDINKTTEEINKQVENIFNSQQCKVIPVSARDYIDGKKENENDLVELSRIDCLKSETDKIISKVKSKIKKTKNERIKNEYNKNIDILKEKLKKEKETNKNITNKKNKIKNKFYSDIQVSSQTLKEMYIRLQNV